MRIPVAMTSHEYTLHNSQAMKGQTDPNPIVSGNGVKNT